MGWNIYLLKVCNNHEVVQSHFTISCNIEICKRDFETQEVSEMWMLSQA